MTFDLRSEPWIPVVMRDGASEKLSLRETFERANQVRRVSASLPTQSFAVLRLLLAIHHDAIGFHSDADVAAALRGGIDQQAIMTYLDRYQDRFDLFHPMRPFMQVATLRTAKNEASPLEKLISDVPNGAQFLTTRAGAGLREISAAEAALWLVHAQAFDASGIRSGAVGDAEVKGGRDTPSGLPGPVRSEAWSCTVAPSPIRWSATRSRRRTTPWIVQSGQLMIPKQSSVSWNLTLLGPFSCLCGSPAASALWATRTA